jgi:hypothetical protein
MLPGEGLQSVLVEACAYMSYTDHTCFMHELMYEPHGPYMLHM